MAIASAATTNVRTRSVQRCLVSKATQRPPPWFLFCFFRALATLATGFQPEFRLLKNGFLQWSLKYQVEYGELSVEEYELEYKKQQVKYLKKKTEKFGFQLMPA